MAEEASQTTQTNQPQTPEIQDRVVHIGRVVKVVKGGRRFSFNALVVSGDGAGRVGYGLGKASEVPEAISKGATSARKNMKLIAIAGATLPCPVNEKFGASKIMLLPAKKGAGIIAGGCVRAVVELAGIQDVVSKCHGSSNPHNLLKAVFKGLMQLKNKQDILAKRGLAIEEQVSQTPTQDGSPSAPKPQPSEPSSRVTHTDSREEEGDR